MKHLIQYKGINQFPYSLRIQAVRDRKLFVIEINLALGQMHEQ